LASNPKSLHLWTLPDPVEFFELTFKIVLNLTKVKNENSFNLTFTNFTINDPCLDEHYQLRECENEGIIKRNYTKFTCDCHCRDGFYGRHCEKINYCFQKMNGKGAITGNELCKQQKMICNNIKELKSWECKCNDEDDKWDQLALR